MPNLAGSENGKMGGIGMKKAIDRERKKPYLVADCWSLTAETWGQTLLNSLACKARLHMGICVDRLRRERARALRIGFAAANILPAFHSMGYQQESFSLQFVDKNIIPSYEVNRIHTCFASRRLKAIICYCGVHTNSARP